RWEWHADSSLFGLLGHDIHQDDEQAVIHELTRRYHAAKAKENPSPEVLEFVAKFERFFPAIEDRRGQ
ncbi:MAG: hypothetical protein ACYC7E_22740, partial [Armatimonadota bacterium]